MIIGAHREQVIENIRAAAAAGNFYAKVEIDDPVLTPEESAAVVERYLARQGTFSNAVKTRAARRIANTATALLNRGTEFKGAEKLNGLQGGLITSNHFSPLENTAIRALVRAAGQKRLTIISQETNQAMQGPIGFLMNYADIIPINNRHRYLHGEFPTLLKQRFNAHEYVLIYPEKEMWFNYRKPRPFKRGAYYYAVLLNVPVISCFVEQRELEEWEKDPQFRKIRYIVHVLGVLRPDPALPEREQSMKLCAQDYALKKAAYESVYEKPLTYDFTPWDIAGWREGLQ